jgi:hypothetical protein
MLRFSRGLCFNAVTSLDLRRLAIAFACSIAFHEAAVALIPGTAPPQHEREIVTHVTIARVERRPLPTPTPTPTPPPVHVAVHAALNSGRHAHVERIKHVGARRPTPPKSHLATPDVAVVPTGGTGAGAQHGANAGSTSNVEGNGNGTGSLGSGNGAQMCGAVDFESEGAPQFDTATGEYVRANIIATVYYADGSSERIPLDWAWHWKSEDDDPFNNSDALMLFQFPPPDKVAGEPPAIAYIIAHTTPTGHTRLTDRCPNIPPPPPTPHSNRAATAGAARP